MLEVNGLHVRYGQLEAVSNVSLRVDGGQTVAIIGANGAGKSTLMRTIAGLHPPASGTVVFGGTDITNAPSHRRVALGLVMVPEGRRLFPSLTLRENLQVGAVRARKGQWTVPGLLKLFPWMKERLDRPTAYLSGGEQQAVAIGRALLANPRLLMLDELSLGLAPVVAHQMYDLVLELRREGLAVLLVEQDVTQALRVSDYAHCLLEGRIRLSGRPRELAPAQVEAAYFGVARAVK